MFYGQCWTCGERWELGTVSTCKCPTEINYTFTPDATVRFYCESEFKQPKTLLSIDAEGEVTYHWDAIQEKAAEYQPKAYNETNTAWAYAMWKFKNGGQQ